MTHSNMQRRTAGTNGIDLPLLGLGCMRLPAKQEAADAVMQAALDAGVTYFDTAYIYPGKEEQVGNFMAKYGCRDQVQLATKLPVYRCKKTSDFDRIFEEELKRLQTDHIDFFLLHMLTSYSAWERARALGIEKWLEERKATGQIMHIGFSFHGGINDFKQIVDSYGWEFCMIQLNYYDAHAQAGLEGLKHASNRGLPVLVMEPLRGGSLANKLPKAARKLFQAADPNKTAAEWGLQWVFNRPEVTCVLSGMVTPEMVQQNAQIASRVTANSLTSDEMKVYTQVTKALRKASRVGCTGCGYCMPCPHGVDIPTCFQALNVSETEGWRSGFFEYVQNTTLRKDPSNAGNCTKCGACEKHCPQSIPIREKLDEVRKTYEGLPYKFVSRFKGIYYRS